MNPSRLDRLGIDLTSQTVLDDPHPVYQRLQEICPVYWNASLSAWVLTRHTDVRTALKDPAFSVEKIEPYAKRMAGHEQADKLSHVLRDWMVFKDPPRHDVLRAAMQKAFLARDVPSLAPLVKARVNELLDGLPPQGEIDLVAEFAYPLPASVISDLFGLPREETPQLKTWSDHLGRFVLGNVDTVGKTEKYAQAGQAIQAMAARFHRLLDEHHQAPQEDFTSLLLHNGQGLSDEEMVHTMILVLFAGHETTTNLIASSALILARHPPLFTLLAREQERLSEAIEEFLRYAGPVQSVVRLAKEEVCYAEQTIKVGERVYLVLNAANRDPAAFTEPDKINLERSGPRHVSFGPGVHFCLGAPLARLEAKLALHGLLERFETLALTKNKVVYRPELIIHGPTSLPIKFKKRIH